MMLTKLCTVSLVVGFAATSSACTGSSPAADERVEHQPTQVAAEWADVFSASTEPEALLAALERYDARVVDTDKQRLAEESGNLTLTAGYVRLKRADILHDLGRFEEAVKFYRSAEQLADPEFPPSFTGYRRVLAEHEISLVQGVRVADASVLADLKALEKGLSATDTFTDDLSYHIGIGSIVAGQPDVDRLVALSNAIDLAATTSSDALIHATTLSFTIDALVDAGRRPEAEALFAKLVQLDAVHATGLSTNGLGQRAIAGN